MYSQSSLVHRIPRPHFTSMMIFLHVGIVSRSYEKRREAQNPFSNLELQHKIYTRLTCFLTSFALSMSRSSFDNLQDTRFILWEVRNRGTV